MEEIKIYGSRPRNVSAVHYDGSLSPVKHLLKIANADYDQESRNFVVPAELMVDGKEGVLKKGQVIFVEEGSDLAVITSKSTFDKYYQLNQ